MTDGSGLQIDGEMKPRMATPTKTPPVMRSSLSSKGRRPANRRKDSGATAVEQDVASLPPPPQEGPVPVSQLQELRDFQDIEPVATIAPPDTSELEEEVRTCAPLGTLQWFDPLRPSLRSVSLL